MDFNTQPAVSGPPQWSTISVDPDFKALGPDDQEAVRNKYFDKVIAPNEAPEHLPAIRKVFDERTASPEVKQKQTTAYEAQDNVVAQPERSGLASSVAKFQTQNEQSAINTAADTFNEFKPDNSGDGWIKQGIQWIGQRIGGPILGTLGLLGSPAMSTAQGAVEQIAHETYNLGKPEGAGPVPQAELQQAHNVAGAEGAMGANIGLTLLGAMKPVADIAGGKAAYDLGGNLKSTLSPEAQANLKEYTSIPKEQQPYNLPTSAVAQDPFAAQLENKVAGVSWEEGGKTVTPRNELAAQKEQNLAKASENLNQVNSNNANPEGVGQAYQQEAQNTVSATKAALEKAKQGTEQAQQGLQGAAEEVKNRVISDPVTKQPITVGTADKYAGEEFLKEIDYNRISERNAYKNIVEDKEATVPAGDITVKANEIASDADVDSLLLDRNGKRIMEKYQTQGPKSDDEIPNFSMNLGAKHMGRFGVETSVRENTPDVKVTDILQDIADLNAIKTKHGAAMQNPLNANKGLDTRVVQAADTAKQTLEGVIQDTPYASAYNSAKQLVSQNNAALFRNPNITRTTISGNQATADSQFTGLKNQYLGGENVSRTKVGEAIYNPTEAEDTLANIKNVPNGAEYFKQQALTRIVDSLGDKPTVEAFDKAVPQDTIRAMKANGLNDQVNDILELRKNLAENEGDLTKQQDILKQTELDSKQVLSNLDKSTSSKFLDDNYKAIPKEQQIDKILKDTQLQNEVLTKAQSLNDNGATSRGIGQNILDKLKTDNIENTRDSANNPIQKLNAKSFGADLDKYNDILSKTLDTKSLKALKDVNEIAQKLEYSTKFRTGGNILGQPETALHKGLAVEAGSKVLNVGPPSAILHSLTALEKLTTGRAYKVLLKAQDPYIAQAFMDAADKSPYTLNSFINKLAATGGTGIINTGTSNENVPEGPANTLPKGDTNVEPQSDNSAWSNTINALSTANSKKNFQLSDLSPISDAEASEIKTPVNSPISSNVANFKLQDKGALQAAIKRQGANATEIMTMINAESGVKKVTGNGYAQITPSAWKQSETNLGRKLNRKNADDYADAAVSYYKWTSDQVKKVLGTEGTPASKDVYVAYNAGIAGFKALHNAPPNTRSIDVVPKSVSDNNSYFYYNTNTGTPLTTKQTLNAYKTFVEKKMNEYAPDKGMSSTKATKLALSKAGGSRND